MSLISEQVMKVAHNELIHMYILQEQAGRHTIPSSPNSKITIKFKGIQCHFANNILFFSPKNASKYDKHCHELL